MTDMRLVRGARRNEGAGTMSTSWYFECTEHDPPIASTDEFTQHTDDEYFRAGLALAGARPLPEKDFAYHDDIRDYFDGNARRFLYQHPKCHLRLVNEYGDYREIETTGHSTRAPGDTGNAAAYVAMGRDEEGGEC